MILRVDPWIRKFKLPQRLDHILPVLQKKTDWEIISYRIEPERKLGYYFGYLLAFIATIPVLLSKKYDVLLMENPYLSFFAPFAKLRRKKVITEYVDFYPSMLIRLRKERLLRYMVATVVCRVYSRFSDKIINESRTTYLTLKQWKVPEHKLMVIPVAIDTELFEFSSDRREKIRKSLGIDKDEFVIGYTGKMPEYYNLEAIVDAIDQAKSLKAKKVRGLFIGDGPLRSKLEQSFQKLNITAIFTGTRPREELPGYYSAMDLFIFPLNALAIKIGELLSMGTPLIAVQGMIADWIEDGVNGYLSRSSKPEDLSKKIDEFLSLHESQREKVSQTMREFAKEKLSLEKVASLYLQVLAS
ncbi:MAG: glycosyltransferase [Candidatus Odinarchaeota archaeon]